MNCFTFTYWDGMMLQFTFLLQIDPILPGKINSGHLSDCVGKVFDAFQPRVSIGDSCEISNPIHSFGAFLLPPSHLECQPLTDSSSKTFMR